MKKLFQALGPAIEGPVFPPIHALTPRKYGPPAKHPLHDSSYEGGSSNGIISTHFPMIGQHGIQVKCGKTGDIDTRVFNNCQSVELVNTLPFPDYKKSTDHSEIIEKILKLKQFDNNLKIHYQSSKGSYLLNESYHNLSDERARELGFSDNKIEEFKDIRKQVNFESQSQADIYESISKSIFSDDLGPHISIPITSCGTIDCNNIPKNFKHHNLNAFETLTKLHTERLKLNDYSSFIEGVEEENIKFKRNNFEESLD